MLDTSKNSTSAPPAQYRNSTNGQRTAEEVAARFPNAKPNGDGWLIPCPCHQDDKPSLSIRDTDKGILVHCFAGCTEGEGWRDVKRKLGIHKEYTRWDSSAYIVAVYQHPDGLPRPRYRQDHDGLCWRDDCSKLGKHKHIWGEKGRSSSGCYLLTWGDDAPDKTLCIVEGEKAAAALLTHVDGKDYTPVTWNGGASVTRSIFDVVDGRDVILWPDNDGPGKRAMNHAALSALDAGAETVRLVDVADLSEKADAADVDADTALTLLQSATVYEPSENLQEQKSGIQWAVITERGLPLRAASVNVELALAEFPDLMFTYNEFTGVELINGKDADDAEVAKLSRRLQKQLHFCPTKEAIHEAVGNLCRDNPFHPVRDYLASLEWDGRLRLPKFAETYFGASADPLVNAAARLIPCGLAGRVLAPGCKYDYAVTLQGPQGCGKTTSLIIIASEGWHGDSIPLNTFDRSKIVIERSRGKCIIELAELAGFRYSEQDAIKNLVSAQSDEARMAYGRKTTQVPRQFIFVGTTNAETFLRDTTGGRRFPVVPCGNIDQQALERDRDQILAEAVQDVRKILPAAITLPPALFGCQAEQAEERRTIGGFEEWLHEYLSDQTPGNPIVSADLREKMKDDLAGTPIYPNNNEFSQVMEAAGYRQVRRGPQKVRQWVQS